MLSETGCCPLLRSRSSRFGDRVHIPWSVPRALPGCSRPAVRSAHTSQLIPGSFSQIQYKVIIEQLPASHNVKPILYLNKTVPSANSPAMGRWLDGAGGPPRSPAGGPVARPVQRPCLPSLLSPGETSHLKTGLVARKPFHHGDEAFPTCLLVGGRLIMASQCGNNIELTKSNPKCQSKCVLYLSRKTKRS